MATADAGEPMDTSADKGQGENELDISTVSDDHELMEGEELIQVGEYRIKIPLPPSLVASSGKEGEPRLMITHLENENFKSYAQVQTLGPFHKNFTCIVGPNGSGKSNVIDSMLFVFGYRSQKIRCKKTSVLIHNSDQFSNLNSCRVTVFFQTIVDTGPKENDYDVIPNSQFKVSRVGFKDNSSRYYLNDKATNYKEVSLFLRQKGIDLDHNRFLILQGEVESIALMKSKGTTPHEEGMLEFLEDIIGSSRFLPPLGKLEKILERLNIERGEKMNRTKLAERDKNELKGARDEAIRYLRTQNTITKLYNKIFQLEKWETETQVEKTEAKLKDAKEKAQPILDELAEVEKGKKERDTKYQKEICEYKKIEQDIEESQKNFEALERKDIAKREEYKSIKLQGKKKTQQLEKEEANRKDLETMPEARKKELEELKVLLERTQNDKKAAEEVLQRAMAAIKDDAAPIVAEKEKKENELIPLRQRVNKAKSKLTIAEDEKNLFISNQEREKNKLNSIEAQLEQIQEKVASRETELKELEKDVPAEQKELSVAENDLKTVQEREEVLMSQLQQDRGKVEQARSTQRTQASRKGVLGALMEQKRNGAIPGIYGRLGDLGAIDDKYDVAISTAGGPLDNIVVDTVDTAQSCIAYLKSSGVGHATFLCLDKQQRFAHKVREPIQDWPEGVPRLFDLVKVNNDDILPAFYYALQDTLVAKDMEQATRIAFNGPRRLRVVTLGGGMIEASGAMSGGGNRVSRGRMGSKLVAEEQIDPAELRAMEERLNSMTEEARSCHHRRTQLETRAEVLRTSIRNKELNKKKHRNEVESLKTTQPKLMKQIAECKEQIKKLAPDENQLAHLESKVEEANTAYEAEVAAAADSEAQVKKLAADVKEAMEGRVKGPKSHVDRLEKQITKINGDITKTNVAVKTAGRNIVACEEKIESIKKEIVDSKERESQLRSELEALTNEAREMIENKDEKAEKKKEMKTTLNELKKEIDKMEKVETDLKTKQQTVMQELEVVQSELASQKDALKHKLRQLAGLKLNPIDPKMSESVRPDSDDEEDTVELVQYTFEQMSSFKVKTLNSEVTTAQERLDQMSPNMAAIEEYEKKNRAYVLRWNEFQECTERRDYVREKLSELKTRRLDEFLEGFQIINRKLKEMYQTITLGGDAELELEDSLDPFAEGVSFSVRPPKKTWKKITNLSGGEKTLSSLSLVFALHHYKPTPFYVMDEIDAALDFKNVSIVGHYIKERTSNAQFIIISLRNNMFELANRLVGIYKTYNCTKCVALSLENVDAAADVESASNNEPLPNGELPIINNNVVPPPSAKISASQSQIPSQIGPTCADEDMTVES